MRLESDIENIGELAPTGIRIPTILKKKLKEEARNNNRSLNSEIVARLASSFDKQEGMLLPPEGIEADDLKAIADLAKRLKKYTILGQ